MLSHMVREYVAFLPVVKSEVFVFRRESSLPVVKGAFILRQKQNFSFDVFLSCVVDVLFILVRLSEVLLGTSSFFFQIILFLLINDFPSVVFSREGHSRRNMKNHYNAFSQEVAYSCCLLSSRRPVH